MNKRTIYKVVHATPDQNEKGDLQYIICLELVASEQVAKKLRAENGDDYHIAIELHHESKRENEWGWQVDWKSFPDTAIEQVGYY